MNKYTRYIPNISKEKVIKVYDGDTITIISKIPWLFKSKTYKFSIRLAGIDAPEIKSKNPHEVLKANRSRSALARMILNKKVKLKHLRREKYGRILCDVYYKGTNINKWMILKGYAVKYNGGKKTIFV